MAEVELILFDDDVARGWQPFTLTRPAAELLFGTMTLRARAERIAGARCRGHFTDAALRGFDEPGTPPVLDGVDSRSDRDRVFISARAVLSFDAVVDAKRTATLHVGKEIAGWVVPAREAAPAAAEFAAPRTRVGASVELPGAMLRNVWDLIPQNAERIKEDVRALYGKAKAPKLPSGVSVIGNGRIVLGERVQIEPEVVFDVSAGPVLLEDDVVVRAFSRIAGPFYAARRTILLGGPYSACSIGPVCRIHGEMEESILLGYTNKAHDGFLGHAILGMWVNLGALTTNSDLKNNYSNIRINTGAGEVDTGLMKLGSLIGDHVKTAIGTMLNTGTVVGAGSNIFGGMPPKYVRPFSWGSGEYRFEDFIATAQRVAQRRNLELSAAQKDMLQRAWRRAREQI